MGRLNITATTKNSKSSLVMLSKTMEIREPNSKITRFNNLTEWQYRIVAQLQVSTGYQGITNAYPIESQVIANGVSTSFNGSNSLSIKVAPTLSDGSWMKITDSLHTNGIEGSGSVLGVETWVTYGDWKIFSWTSPAMDNSMSITSYDACPYPTISSVEMYTQTQNGSINTSGGGTVTYSAGEHSKNLLEREICTVVSEQKLYQASSVVALLDELTLETSITGTMRSEDTVTIIPPTRDPTITRFALISQEFTPIGEQGSLTIMDRREYRSIGSWSNII